MILIHGNSILIMLLIKFPLHVMHWEIQNIVACWVFHATNKFILSGCSESLMVYHSYTVQLLSLYNSTVSGPLALSFSCLWPSGGFPLSWLSRSSADGIRDTALQVSISCVWQSVASEMSRLIRCYSTGLPFLGKRVCWFLRNGLLL
jgi:hypothetical protein